jgi:hypothetical protein
VRSVAAIILALAAQVAAGPSARPKAERDTDVPAVQPTLTVTASATSTLSQKGKTYEAWYALGGDPTKFWCEGKPDEGIGEALVLKLAVATTIESLTLRAGVWRSPELFHANNRITELTIVTDDGRTKKVPIREERENVDVALGGAPVKQLELRIAAVTKGKADDTCISGVELHTNPASGLVLVTTSAPALADELAKVWRAFGDCTEAALRTEVQYPFALDETWTHAKHYKDAKALRKACKDGAFSTFEIHTTSLQVKTEGPNKASLQDEVLVWHFALVSGAWKLASLEDGSP